jgi:uncharacterized protein YkwD
MPHNPTGINLIPKSGMLTAKAKILVLLALSLFCIVNHPAAKEDGGDLGKKQKKDRADSPSKEPILLMEEALLRYTNEERERRKLPSLRTSTGLQFLARGHSTNMCEIRTLQHESNKFPEGWRYFAGRLKMVGLKSGAENIAFRTAAQEPHLWAKEVVRGWMNSTEHRKNILDARFAYIGIGVTPCAKRIMYAAQVFSMEPGHVPQTRK